MCVEYQPPKNIWPQLKSKLVGEDIQPERCIMHVKQVNNKLNIFS